MPLSHLEFLISLKQEATKGFIMLTRVIDCECQGEIGLILHNGGEKEIVWSTGDLLGLLWVLQCSVIKVNKKLQPNPGRNMNDLDHLEMKVWTNA